VVIAEDSVLLLAGLTKLLDGAGFEVCATPFMPLDAFGNDGPDIFAVRIVMSRSRAFPAWPHCLL
jgi:hypothetical protein